MNIFNINKNKNIDISYSFEFNNNRQIDKKNILSIIKNISDKKNKLRIRDYDSISTYKVMLKQSEYLKGSLDNIKKYIISNLKKVLSELEKTNNISYQIFIIGEVKFQGKRYTFRLKIEKSSDLCDIELIV